MDNGDLIFTQAYSSSYNNVNLFNYKFKRTDTLAGSSSYGYADGNATAARYRSPMGLVKATEEIVMIADQGNNRVGILNLTNNFTTIFCTGMPKVCSFHSPTSLLLTNDALLIGENNRIVKVRGKWVHRYIISSLDNIIFVFGI